MKGPCRRSAAREAGLKSSVCIETPRRRLLIPPLDFAGRYLAYFERNREHLARWDPPRPEGFYTGLGFRDTGERSGEETVGVLTLERAQA